MNTWSEINVSLDGVRLDNAQLEFLGAQSVEIAHHPDGTRKPRCPCGYSGECASLVGDVPASRQVGYAHAFAVAHIRDAHQRRGCRAAHDAAWKGDGMKLRDTPENRVTAAILAATTADVDWLRNPAGGVVTKSGHDMRIGLGGVLGTSDWIGIVRRTGRVFALELKAPGKKPDLRVLDHHIRARDYCPGPCSHARCRVVHQELFLRRIRAAGGLGCFADCVEDVQRELRRAA